MTAPRQVCYRPSIVMKPLSILTLCAALTGGIALLSSTSGCTQNQRARQFGGTATITTPTGEKVIGATWKGNQLWVLTRPIHAGEKPETLHLRESSSFGVLEGVVVIREQ